MRKNSIKNTRINGEVDAGTQVQDHPWRKSKIRGFTR